MEIKKTNGSTVQTTWPGVDVSSGDEIGYIGVSRGPINTKLECYNGKAFDLAKEDLDVKIEDLCK